MFPRFALDGIAGVCNPYLWPPLAAYRSSSVMDSADAMGTRRGLLRARESASMGSMALVSAVELEFTTTHGSDGALLAGESKLNRRTRERGGLG